MPTFKRCDEEVNEMAAEIFSRFETHQMLIDAKVRIDYVFAYGDRDDDGQLVNDALKKNGVRALGLTRKIPLKDRALNRGDAEIALDGDWWSDAGDEEKKALLDHELHHLIVKVDERGIVTDDLGRPLLKLRPHDYDFGFFAVIAARHGSHSQEQKQAKLLMDNHGQYFFPGITPTVDAESTRQTSARRFAHIAKDMAKEQVTK